MGHHPSKHPPTPPKPSPKAPVLPTNEMISPTEPISTNEVSSSKKRRARPSANDKHVSFKSTTEEIQSKSRRHRNANKHQRSRGDHHTKELLPSYPENTQASNQSVSNQVPNILSDNNSHTVTFNVNKLPDGHLTFTITI